MEVSVTHTNKEGYNLMTSIFGGMDIEGINDDPFFIAPNTYWAVCTEAKIQEKDGNQALIIVWQIDEPDSEYNGNTVREFYRLFPGRQFDELDAKEKKSVKFLLRRLRQGFDCSEEERANITPSELVGRSAYITTTVTDGTDANEGKQFTNVGKALCKRLFEEERGGVDNSTGSFGL